MEKESGRIHKIYLSLYSFLTVKSAFHYIYPWSPQIQENMDKSNEYKVLEKEPERKLN